MRPGHLLALAPLLGAALAGAQHNASAPTQPGLESRLRTLLQQPGVAGAHWGISVVRLDGVPVVHLDESRLFRPASTAKLFTTAAAMGLLGPDATEDTTVSGALDSTTGVVAGDLVLRGAGDPAFNTTDLPYTATPRTGTPKDIAALAAALAARGVRQITGNIVGDDQLFAAEPPPPGWAAEDLAWGYGALPTALATGDNEVAVQITADPAGTGPATVQSTPTLPAEQLTSEVRSVSATGRGDVDAQRLPHGINLFGTVAAGSPLREHLALPDPARTAAASLRDELLARGIAVEGAAQSFHAPATDATPFLHALQHPAPCAPAPDSPGTTLVAVTSAPLWQDIVFTLKTSANLHAETMLRRLGLKPGCAAARSVDGVRAVQGVAREAGVAETDLVLYDGSGLSTKDLVTPRAETQLLVWAARQPWFARWQQALPVGGVDGTLASRFTGDALRGRVLAKTGTLGESRALAGYVQCRDGSQLAFAILVDDHLPGTTADRETMDQIVTAIAHNARGTASASAACVP